MQTCKWRDWWLIVHRGVNSSLYYKYLITPLESMALYSKYRLIPGLFWTDYSLRMENTMHIIRTNQDLDIYQFDRCTVILWIQFRLPLMIARSVSVLHFLPIQKGFYLSSTNYVYQFGFNCFKHCCIENHCSSIRWLLFSSATIRHFCFYLSQLAPDGKYISIAEMVHLIFTWSIIRISWDWAVMFISTVFICHLIMHLQSLITRIIF